MEKGAAQVHGSYFPPASDKNAEGGIFVFDKGTVIFMVNDEGIQVERALLKRALGYDYVETRTEESDKGFKRIETTKHIPPDTKALIFWLKNRMPERWSDTRFLEHEGSVEIDEIRSMESLTTEELLEKAYGNG